LTSYDIYQNPFRGENSQILSVEKKNMCPPKVWNIGNIFCKNFREKLTQVNFYKKKKNPIILILSALDSKLSKTLPEEIVHFLFG
jgi:hypothetical protein